MKDKIFLKDHSDLKSEVMRQLLEHGLISGTDKLNLCPHHRVLIHNEWFYHYIITCTYSRQTFFLKAVKENDNSLLCDCFLRNIDLGGKEFFYPKIVVPEFAFQGIQYYITTYIEGQPLDTFPDTLPQSTWSNVADKLLFLIDQLTLVKTSQYSEHGAFVPDNCANILKKKLEAKLRHPLIIKYPHKKLEQAFIWSCEILDQSLFSPPTLIHMDIKPANIIYNTKTGSLSLIDFEFARFGDIDYGWTQIILSGCNNFNQFYKEQIIPHLTCGRLTLSDAIEIPKFQCYLFYQTMCNLIYYYDHHLSCPEEMKKIFDLLISKI